LIPTSYEIHSAKQLFQKFGPTIALIESIHTTTALEAISASKGILPWLCKQLVHLSVQLIVSDPGVALQTHKTSDAYEENSSARLRHNVVTRSFEFLLSSWRETEEGGKWNVGFL